eukprot:CAMPEP_0174266912 /NCGR_PEP_ID=MMETSP0439-20130205/31901_1 /TAXON_ID=0 /ORGANISM="Stereomyxa ramosa, Strain Chinc5" /LENGTH=1083 /DNA_ID=CAMNT_0015354161 /DNA_START=59 /DNA_END=3310 /DNA_ORIENTATION=+
MEEAIDESLSDVWDAMMDPVALHLDPYEQTKVINMIKTDNKLFNKIMLVFASLCVELRKLSQEAKNKFLPPFLLFGEDEEPQEGEVQIQIGRLIKPFLLDMSNFVNRCYLVIQNVVRQLGSLYHPSQKLYLASFKDIHLTTVFEHLGSLLASLITLDQAIKSNETFQHAWQMYKRMTKTIRAQPARYNTEEQTLVQFEKLILSLEGQLFDGLIFKNSAEQEFDFPGLVEVRQNRIFRQEFLSNIKAILSSHLTALSQKNEGFDRNQYVGLCALIVLHYTIYKDIAGSKAVFKQIFELHQKIPVVHLNGNVIFSPPEFFIRQVPDLVRTLGKLRVSKFRNQYLSNLDKVFVRQVQQIYLQASVWMVRMESNLTNRADIRNILSTRIVLLSQGPELASNISNMIREMLYLHLYMQTPLRKEHIEPLFQCIEMIKAIQITFHRRSSMIAQSINFMLSQQAFRLQNILYPLKKRLEGNQKYSDAKLDVLAAVTLSLQMISGSATVDRLLVLTLCKHIACHPSFLKSDEIAAIQQEVEQLGHIVCFSQRMREVCNCEFLYWNRNMLPVHFKNVYISPSKAHKLHYLFAAFPDVLASFSHAVFKDFSELKDKYTKEVRDHLTKEILDRLCLDIETDLRLHVHHHLKVSNQDPFREGIKDLLSLVQIRPIRFFDTTIDFKGFVEHYLDETFYNLTTVALYDWETYGEMRNLAAEKFGLKLTDVHLPGQTMEQGLDVLEIMRNIHIFVSNFNFNLNNQIFIESNTDNKSIMCINIKHIANSIRTHGTGIMNTTVNFTYQFLRRKFVIFSQFLYDDHIKARLYKDIRFFKEKKKELDNLYPFKRTEVFNKEIRKLGITKNGLSYLDQFRVLITEIGNAMGYVQMIRAGGLYYTSNGIKFVPDLREIEPLLPMVEQANLPQHTKDAAKNFDAVVGNLAANFAEGTEYFKMLVNVFAGEFRDERNVHLKNFHVIIPPLTLNFISYLLKMKDNLGKKGAKKVVFSDDGFAMGLAYILKLLDQNEEFDSLHWWESVAAYHKEQEEKLEQLLNDKKRGRDKEELQTVVLTVKKFQNNKREFELLKFCFNGARIFFKD